MGEAVRDIAVVGIWARSPQYVVAKVCYLHYDILAFVTTFNENTLPIRTTVIQ